MKILCFKILGSFFNLKSFYSFAVELFIIFYNSKKGLIILKVIFNVMQKFT